MQNFQAMKNSGRIVSVNVGQARSVSHNGAEVTTGIFKTPVSAPVMALLQGLKGDVQVDRRYHGGTFKAVYAYPQEHFEWWQEQLGLSAMEPGFFGENLSIRGLLESQVHIGDILQVGDAHLKVTQPRTPCSKLAMRSGKPQIIKTMLDSGRSGFYLQVVKEGLLRSGDTIALLERGTSGFTIAGLQDLVWRDADNIEGAQRALEIEHLAGEWRKPLQKRLREHGLPS